MRPVTSERIQIVGDNIISNNTATKTSTCESVISMKQENSIILFDQKEARRYWDKNEEEWYFAIIDIENILTDSTNPRRYWSDLKSKLKQEGSQVYENIVHLN